MILQEESSHSCSKRASSSNKKVKNNNNKKTLPERSTDQAKLHLSFFFFLSLVGRKDIKKKGRSNVKKMLNKNYISSFSSVFSRIQ